MKNLNTLRAFSYTALTLVLVLMIVGCGGDSFMEPTAGPPNFARVIDDSIDNSASMGRSFIPTGTSGIGRDDGLPGPLTVTIPVDPTVGGEFTEGRFTVDIPPGATEDTLYLTIEDLTEETGLVIVELGPHGIVFDKPVTLTIDLKGTTLENYEDVTIFWYNEEIGAWEDINGTYDAQNKTVSTQLNHFSRYGGGRAGWNAETGTSFTKNRCEALDPGSSPY